MFRSSIASPASAPANGRCSLAFRWAPFSSLRGPSHRGRRRTRLRAPISRRRVRRMGRLPTAPLPMAVKRTAKRLRTSTRSTTKRHPRRPSTGGTGSSAKRPTLRPICCTARRASLLLSSRTLINFALLVFVVVRFGKAPLAASLLKRKESILREIDEARQAAPCRRRAPPRSTKPRWRRSAKSSSRVRREFRQQGERDQQRIVAEAKQRRDLMQKDAALLLEQESKQLRKDLIAEVVEEAARKATDLLATRHDPRRSR